MRNIIINIIIVILFSFSISLAQNNEKGFNELRNQLDDSFGDVNFNNSVWGAYVISLKTGEVLYSLNKDKLFLPGSIVKLFTTSTALMLLGDDYNYKTEVYTDGKIKGNILNGNLIVKGSGDPTLSSESSETQLPVFSIWTDRLKQKKIVKIEGNIIGDDNIFNEVYFGKGWLMDYEINWYAPPTGALSYNNNSITVEITPTSPGINADYHFIPENNFLNIVIDIKTSEENETAEFGYHRNIRSGIYTVSGKIPVKGKSIILQLSVPDPTEFFISNMKESLVENGIEVTGYVTDADNEENLINYDDLTPLFSHKSGDLIEIITEINKNSNNFYAEQLLKTLGYELYGYGDSKRGILAVKQIMKKAGINTNVINIVDGSGLSRLNLITPKQVVTLLNYIYKSDSFKLFFHSLPVAGVDGNLADRMKINELKYNVNAKPGYLEGVSSLAGFLKTADGEPIAFTFIVNNYLVPPQLANFIIDSACQKLVNFSRN